MPAIKYVYMQNLYVTHVFSRTVAAVDTKCGYIGMCNRRSVQQESGAALSNVYGVGQNLYTCTAIILGVH